MWICGSRSRIADTSPLILTHGLAIRGGRFSRLRRHYPGVRVSMRPFAAVLFVLIAAFLGCSSGKDEVVVSAPPAREFSEPILNDFTSETGISVVAEYDIESTKSVGKTQQIMAEANRPRCDVFWNN